MNPTLPTLQNTDRDPIELTTMTYQLGVTAAEAFERLRPLAMLRGDAHADGEVHDSAGAMAAAELTWIKAGNRQHKDWDNTTLGTLRLNGPGLMVEVNSARRRNRIAKDIAKRFENTATLVETKVTDVMKELESRRDRRAKAGRTATSPAPPGRPRSRRSTQSWPGSMHWDAWIDTKIPALVNQTPRQAAKTARGRARLTALLADFASTGERSPSTAGRMSRLCAGGWA